jgi:ApaG protein
LLASEEELAILSRNGTNAACRARFAEKAEYDIIRDTMFLSEATTRSIRVSVQSQFDPSRSSPGNSQWFFLYTVKIANEGKETVQLVSRHWIITDGMGKVEEVQGPGVIGKQPTLAPGQSFEYTSGCPLTTPFGSMHGTYQMINQTAEQFEIEIAPFTLSEPYTTVN